MFARFRKIMSMADYHRGEDLLRKGDLAGAKLAALRAIGRTGESLVHPHILLVRALAKGGETDRAFEIMAKLYRALDVNHLRYNRATVEYIKYYLYGLLPMTLLRERKDLFSLPDPTKIVVGEVKPTIRRNFKMMISTS